MPWEFKVYADVPDIIVSQRGITLIDNPRESVGDWRARTAYANDMMYEPLIGGYMLTPMIYSNNYPWPAEYYEVYPGDVGQEWITVRDCWGEFGTYWLCRREAMLGSGGSGRWAAYLNTGTTILHKDRGIFYDMYLLPPSGNPTHGRLNNITFYPRINGNYVTVDSDNIPRYWAPYRAILYSDRFVLQEIAGDPVNPPAVGTPEYYAHYQTVYEHPFEGNLDMSVEYYSKRQRIMFLPIRENQLIVKAEFLKNGGFVYRTELDRGDYHIFNEGQAGVVVNNAGPVFMQINPTMYPAQGVYYSGVKTISSPGTFVAGDVVMSVDSTAPISGGYIVGYSITDIAGDAFDSADEVEEFRYKLQIDVTNQFYTPVINEVTIGWESETEEKSFTPSYIEDDILSLEESVSEDQMSTTVKMLLRDPEGIYKTWLSRVSLAFDYDWVETIPAVGGEGGEGEEGEGEEGEGEAEVNTHHRAMLFMDDISYDEDMPSIEVVCRDGWRRLDEVRLGAVPKGDGKVWTTYIRELLEWSGWDSTKIAFVDQNGNPYTDAVALPESSPGDEPAYLPEPGATFTDFFQQIHEEFAPEDMVYIDGNGVFTIVKGDGYIPVSAKTFYWSHEDAASAGDWCATIDRNSWREQFLIKNFRNLIWVVGAFRGDTPIVSYYADSDSVTNPLADNYTGEWRMMIFIDSGLQTQENVDWVCRSLAHQYARVRRTAEFTSHFYPELRVGDFITIDGSEITNWQITSIRYDINSGTLYNDPSEGEKVSKCSYGIKEWVGRYA